jgi:hypothetical protein
MAAKSETIRYTEKPLFYKLSSGNTYRKYTRKWSVVRER